VKLSRKADLPIKRNKIRQRNAEGFAMLAVVIIMLMVAVLMMMTTPDWVTLRRRDKEAEAIYRGETIALAIREFRAENNRYPTELKELMAVGPRQHRYLRQLYTEPLSSSGEWDLIPVGDPSTLPPGAPGAPGAILPTPIATGGAADDQLQADDLLPTSEGAGEGAALAGGRQPRKPLKIGRCRPGLPGAAGGIPGLNGINPSGLPGGSGQPPIGNPIGVPIGVPIGTPLGGTAGPGSQIAGVSIMVDERAIRNYNGKQRYCEWVFLANPPVQPGQNPLGQPQPGQPGQPGQPPPRAP
jgi:type II secretory pathway pseudopilin PulG